MPIELERLLQQDKRTIDSWNPNTRPTRPNITPEEQEGLEALTKQTTIVIKLADKGNATVIMDKTEYINEAMRQLNDEQFYKKLQKPIFLNQY